MTLPVRSEIESEHFGISIARVSLSASQEVRGAMEYCERGSIDLLVARCATSDIDVAQEMEANGFGLMDALVYFDRAATAPSLDSEGVTIRVAGGADVESVRAIATDAFRNYPGHYQADARLPRALADSGYVDWAVRSCCDARERHDVLIAQRAGRDAGFVTLKVNRAGGEIGLIATAEDSRASGVGRSLLEASLQWCIREGLPRLSISTQITNLQSQRMICRAGFLPVSSLYTFHWWPK